jgi:hypothetical protein
MLASFARLILFSIFRPGGGATGNNISQTVVIPHSASAIETCLAIIAACSPPCAPLLRRMFNGVIPAKRKPAKSSDEPKNFNTLITIGKISNRSGGRQKQADYDLEGSFVRLEDGSLHGSTDDLYVNNGGTKNDDYGVKGGIRTKSDAQITTVQKRVHDDIPLRDISADGKRH